MALTRKEYTGNGSTTLYNVDFDLGYIDKDYVYVYLVDKSIEDQLSYTWRNDNQIELSAPVASGVKFYVRRVIPRDELVNDYEDGAILREGNLNDSYLQTLMILEEVQDGFITLDDKFLILAKIVISQNLDMQGFRITNAGDAVDNTDLATVNDVIKYTAISKGAQFVQEEQPTTGMVQGSEWFIPSKCETYVYFIQPNGTAYWVNEDSVGDDISYETVGNGSGGTLRTDLDSILSRLAVLEEQ